MKFTKCSDCQSEFPLNDTWLIEDKFYCHNCIDKNFSGEDGLKGKRVLQPLDPSVCNTCKNDFGDLELEKNFVYPICDDCKIILKAKIFPNWVKAFFVALLATITISISWNWKYFKAFRYYKEANAFFSDGDYANASLKIENATNSVPNNEDLQLLFTYYHGVDMLYKNENEVAFSELTKVHEKWPEDKYVNSFMLYAKAGLSFQKGDYPAFLNASKQDLAENGPNPTTLTAVASAYACLYASSNDANARLNSIAYLDSAKEIDNTSASSKDYYNRVEYRLFSKKIITKEEFLKQFPNGWTKQ